jgi:methyl-accepting chemotaxis protein
MIGTRVAALALALALAAGGCGGGDDEAGEFRDGYNAAVERLNEVNSGVQQSGQNLAGKSGAEISREFGRIADIAAQTRDRLEDLDPPEDAADEFEELLAAVDQGVEDIRSAAEAARREDPERFAEAAEALTESGEEINEAEKALKDAVDQ